MKALERQARGWRRENTATGAKGYQGPASRRDIVYQAQRVAAGGRHAWGVRRDTPPQVQDKARKGWSLVTNRQASQLCVSPRKASDDANLCAMVTEAANRRNALR
jgi:hypothetical protein